MAVSISQTTCLSCEDWPLGHILLTAQQGKGTGRARVTGRVEGKHHSHILSKAPCSVLSVTRLPRSYGGLHEEISHLWTSSPAGGCHKSAPVSASYHYVNGLFINLTNYQENMLERASILSPLSFN